MNLHFLELDFLYLLYPLAVLLVLWLLVTAIKLARRPKRTFGSKYPLIGKIKLWGLCAIPAGVLMVLAMAKPTLNQGAFSTSRGDIEVILVVDRSISMRADDVRPSRLDIAKREAANIEQLLKDGDKAALFVFGKESHKKIELSEKFSENIFYWLSRISFPESLEGDGLVWDSNFAVMLENIYQSMDRQDSGDRDYLKHRYVPKKRTNRIVILFSDGEDQFKKEKPETPQETEDHEKYIKKLNSVLAEFRKRGLKIYPVGVGTQRGIKSLDLLKGYKPEEQNEDFYKANDYPASLLEDWKNDVSRIDKENLIFLSHSTGTAPGNNIWTVENGATTVKNYLNSIINSNRRILLEFGRSEDDEDLWQYFLLAAVVILALGILLHPISGYFSRRKSKQ